MADAISLNTQSDGLLTSDGWGFIYTTFNTSEKSKSINLNDNIKSIAVINVTSSGTSLFTTSFYFNTDSYDNWPPCPLFLNRSSASPLIFGVSCVYTGNDGSTRKVVISNTTTGINLSLGTGRNTNDWQFHMLALPYKLTLYS